MDKNQLLKAWLKPNDTHTAFPNTTAELLRECDKRHLQGRELTEQDDCKKNLTLKKKKFSGYSFEKYLLSPIILKNILKLKLSILLNKII